MRSHHSEFWEGNGVSESTVEIVRVCCQAAVEMAKLNVRLLEDIIDYRLMLEGKPLPVRVEVR